MAKISHKKGAGMLTNFLLVVLIALSAVQIFFLTGNSFSVSDFTFKKANEVTKTGSTDEIKSSDVLGIKKALLEIEYDKVGGKENYDIITAVQRKSLTDATNPQNIEAYKNYLNETVAETTPTNTDQQAATIKTDTEKVSAVLDGAVFEGNKDADIVVVEYSDLECPFCLRQANDNKISENLLEKYGDDITFVFKNNRGVDHQGTEVKALSVLCAKKLGGDEAYIKMYQTILHESTSSQYYAVARLPDLATEIGLDATAFQSCVDKKETLAQFNAETAEAQSFGLSGTPGTLIFNKKTGKYDTISGAYPLQNFVEKIEALKE